MSCANYNKIGLTDIAKMLSDEMDMRVEQEYGTCDPSELYHIFQSRRDEKAAALKETRASCKRHGVSEGLTRHACEEVSRGFSFTPCVCSQARCLREMNKIAHQLPGLMLSGKVTLKEFDKINAMLDAMLLIYLHLRW